MGRWVTSKGRRIYIPDEGEENPYAKRDDDISIRKSAGKTWVAHKSQQGKKRGVRDLDKPFDNEEDAIKFADTIEGRAQEGRKPVSKPTLKDVSSYGYDPADVTGDPTIAKIDGREYYKVGENKWKAHSNSGKVLSESITDEQIAERIKQAKEVKVLPSEKKNAKASQLDKDEAAKSKQIAANKAQADERNGKKDTWHSETPDERKEFLRRKEVAHSLGLKNDVLGQLATDRYTPEGLKDAVERGWITQKQADKINGKKKRKGSK